ncbi:MAG: hypothetical protein WCA98_04345 [Candidatus Acidiferrales bacterium]
MHGIVCEADSVSNIYATEDGDSFHHERFLGTGGIKRRPVSFVRVPTEDSSSRNHDIPMSWDDNFSSAKYGGGVDRRGVAFDFRLRQVEFIAAKNCQQFPAAEILRADSKLSASEDADVIELSFAGGLHFQLFRASPDDNPDPCQDQEKWPDALDAELMEAELVELEQSADDDERTTESTLARILVAEDAKQPGHDENQRPHDNDPVGTHDSRAVEKQENARGEHPGTDEYAGPLSAG